MPSMSNIRRRPFGILYTVNDSDPKDKSVIGNRRRASQIVHDERGNARVEWIDAGNAGDVLERAPLSVEPTPGRGEPQIGRMAVERTRAGGFDPYARVGAAHIREEKKPQGKRDLRKLGEWIKMKRELEARKESGEPDAE